jgi:hypothetical protein
MGKPAVAYTTDVEWTDGSSDTLARRERPVLVFRTNASAAAPPAGAEAAGAGGGAEAAGAGGADAAAAGGADAAAAAAGGVDAAAGGGECAWVPIALINGALNRSNHTAHAAMEQVGASSGSAGFANTATYTLIQPVLSE